MAETRNAQKTVPGKSYIIICFCGGSDEVYLSVYSNKKDMVKFYFI
jgi:hypothetical protein